MSKSMMSAAGGGKVTVSGLEAGKILQGTTVMVKQGSKTVANVAGSITQQGQKVITPNTGNQQVGPGVYLSGPVVITGDPNLVAANILKGKSIFGVAGALDVLAIGGANNAGNVFYWDGSAYKNFFIPDWASGGSGTYLNLTVAGKPMLVVGQGPTSINVCGVVLQNDMGSSNANSNKITGGPAAATFKFVVLGTK